MKYGRMNNQGAEWPSYRSEGHVFYKREWTAFDEVAKPALLADPHLEIVDSIPALVDDMRATNDELRAALRAALGG